jgi:hypothetical protein
MEMISGPAFHIYIFDYDRDGYFDVVMASQVSNEIVYIKNPGSNYWHKVWSIVNSQNSKTQ